MTVLARTAADTSLGTDAASRGLHAARGASDISLSTDVAVFLAQVLDLTGLAIDASSIPPTPIVFGRGSDVLLSPAAIADALMIGSATISNSGPTTLTPAGIPAP